VASSREWSRPPTRGASPDRPVDGLHDFQQRDSPGGPGQAEATALAEFGTEDAGRDQGRQRLEEEAPGQPLGLRDRVRGDPAALPVPVHYGPVYSFWDPGRKDWNDIGDGINGGQRVLAAVGKETDDVVFISGEVRQQLTAMDRGDSPYPQILAALHNRGRKADKHGNPWRVYEVNHTGLTSGTLSSLLRDAGAD
jgi:hypothetical protein